MAARYWVGGTGNWDGSNTSNWSTASGGSGGASVPTSADDVIFDASSGGGTVTITVTVSVISITLGAFTGTVNTNNQTITTSGIFSITGTGTRTVTLGSSSITCAGWNAGAVTNLTFNPNTSTITSTATYAGNIIFSGGGLTYNNVVLQPSSTGQNILSGVNTFANLTVTGSTSQTQFLDLNNNQTITGVLTLTGNSVLNRLFFKSNGIGTTIIVSAGSVTASNVDLQDIQGAGAAGWDLSGITGGSGDCGGNIGITFTSPVNRYGVTAGNWSSTGTWSASSGGSSGASVPLPQDNVFLDSNSPTGTFTANRVRLCSNLDCTGFTGTLTTSTTATLFGSIILSSGMTLTASTNGYTLSGRGNHVLTSAGKTWAKIFTISAPGGTYTLQDNFVATNSLSLTRGSFDANGFDVTITTMSSQAQATSVLSMGSGLWTLTGNGTFWNASGSLTINPGTSTIKLTGTITASRSFFGGNFTYYNFWNATTGDFPVVIGGSNTFNDFRIEPGRTQIFTAGTTQTVGSFTAVGTSGEPIVIDSTTTGTHSLVKTGGGKVGSDYLNIQRCVASPEETWYAGLNSTDNQTTTGGSGWLFTFPLPIVSTQDVTDIESTAFTGNGTVVDNYTVPVVRRGFVVSTSSHTNPGDTDPEASTYGRIFDESGTFGTGAFDLPITDLEELKRYYIRAFAENGAGFSYGNEVISDTPETPERADVSIITIENTGMTTATAHAKIERTNNTATRRGVVLSRSVKSNPGDTSPEDSDYELVFSEIGTYSEGSFMQHITGLEKVKAYHVRAFVENSAGFSYSDKTSFISSLSVSPPTGIGIFIQS